MKKEATIETVLAASFPPLKRRRAGLAGARHQNIGGQARDEAVLAIVGISASA